MRSPLGLSVVARNVGFRRIGHMFGHGCSVIVTEVCDLKESSVSSPARESPCAGLWSSTTTGAVTGR